MTMFALAALAAAQAAAPQVVQPVPPMQPVAPATVARPAVFAPPAVIAPAAPQAVILSSPATESVLRSGSPVPLVLAESINSNSKTLRTGQQIHLTVASPVMLGALTVIPAGAPAIAEITEVRHKGMWGKSGRIEARVLNVRVGERLIRLTGTFDDKGVTGTGGVVAAAVLIPLAGFFVTGTSANIPAGSGVKAFLDEDLRVGVR